MDMNVFNTAQTALEAQRIKMDIAAANLANINTTRDANANINPYKRRVVNFESILDQQNRISGVKVASITEDQSSPISVYDPGHPDADENGYVQYPNVNSVTEMVEIMNAKSVYEANVGTVKAFKSMYGATLEL